MYLSIWPRTRPHRSPNFAKPNDCVKVLRDVWVPIPNDSAMAIRDEWVHPPPPKVTSAPIAVPDGPPALTLHRVAVDAASDTTLKACRINPVVDERLHCTLYVVIVVVAYVARHIVFLPVGPVRSIPVLKVELRRRHVGPVGVGSGLE